MFLESEKLLEVLQYICFTGLILPGLAVFVMPDPRKKAISLFIMFVFITVLSFVFYAGIMLFIVSLVFIFVFVLLYLLARKPAVSAWPVGTGNTKRSIRARAMGTAAAIIFCSGLGYIIIDLSRGYFTGTREAQEIYITSLKDLTESIFTGYNIVVMIIAAAALVTFIGFTVFQKSRQKDGEA